MEESTGIALFDQNRKENKRDSTTCPNMDGNTGTSLFGQKHGREETTPVPQRQEIKLCTIIQPLLQVPLANPLVNHPIVKSDYSHRETRLPPTLTRNEAR